MTRRQYLSHLRLGGAAAVTAADSRSASARFASTVGMRVNDQPVTVPVTLFGPGDVAGLAADAITARAPAPGSVGAEVNWFPHVELAEADLPWRFTPVRPGAGGRLRPWCALVVLEQRPGVAVSVGPGRRLPVVDAPAAELPDLEDADLWAHVEVTLPDGPPPASLPDYLRQHPGAARARLLSPRRLLPGTEYVACLVPAFEVGRLTGLGHGMTGAGTLAPAWTYAPRSTARVTLPVYDSWSFRTGGAADFESLARVIRPHTVSAQVSGRRFALDPAVGPGRSLPLRGALRPVLSTPLESEPVPAAVADAIATRINRAADLAEAGGAPVLGSPLYGSMPAGRQRLREPDTPVWLETANTDPRNRVAAAAGGDLVQRHQEDLVADAWRQVGQLGPVNSLLRGAQVARGVTGRLVARHLQTLPEDLLLQLTGPALARVPASDGTPTVLETVLSSAITEAGFEGAFRRITRDRGPHLRRFGTASPTPGSSFMFEQGQREIELPNAGWSVVDQGTVNAPSAWQPAGQVFVRQRSNIHTPMPDPNGLPYLGTMLVGGPSTMRDVRFSTVLDLRDNDAAGVVFRYRGPTNYYRFSVDPQRQLIRLVKCVNGAFTLLMHKNDQVPMDDKVRIIVQAEGDRIRVRFGRAFVGQALLADVRDGSHPSGQVGLYTWGNEDVVFTDIKLEPQRGLSTSDLPGAVVDQGSVDAPSQWSLDEGDLVQGSNIYTEPRERDHLPKLGTFVRFGFPFWSDYEIQASMRMRDDNDAIGVMFRVASPTRYYRYSVDAERSYRRLVKCVDGQFTLLWQQDVGEDLPMATAVRIVADGSRLRGFLGGFAGAKLFDLRDREHPQGGAALYCWGAEGARFSGVTVRPVSRRGVMGRLNSNSVNGIPIPQNGSLKMGQLRADILTSMEAHHSVRARVLDRTQLPPARTSADPLEPERPCVRFPRPLAPLLAADNPELLLPGLSGVPDNAVVLLTPEPQFVASFLLGANTEIARELAWRGLPTDPKGTAFRQFWDVRDSGAVTPDIGEIAAWPPTRALAKQVTTGSLGSVFLLRSELVRRFPSMAVYLVQAVASSTGRRPGTNVRAPAFGGSLGPDVAYYGFAVPPGEAVGGATDPGWYLVLEQSAGDVRFGLDLSGPDTPATWSELAWTHLDPDDRYAHRTSLAVTPPPGPVWARTAAHMAAITEQQPVRLLVHADRLLAASGGVS